MRASRSAMRILLVNSNTSDIVTEKVAAAARAAASPGTRDRRRHRDVRRARDRHARRARDRRALDDRAGRAACGRLRRGGDRGVLRHRPARRRASCSPIPVVGMTEAGLLTACMLGGRIGVVTFGRRVLPLYQRAGRELRAGRTHRRLARAREHRCLRARRASASSTARSSRPRTISSSAITPRRSILTGAVMAGVPARLQGEVPVPLVDCIACGVQQAELLVRLALPKPRAGSYAAPAGRELVTVDPAIARRFAATPAEVTTSAPRHAAQPRPLRPTRRSPGARRSIGPTASGSPCTSRSTSSTTLSAKVLPKTLVPGMPATRRAELTPGATTAIASAPGGCAQLVRRTPAPGHGAGQLGSLCALSRARRGVSRARRRDRRARPHELRAPERPRRRRRARADRRGDRDDRGARRTAAGGLARAVDRRDPRSRPIFSQEAGYAYLLDWCADDQPLWLATRVGRILAVPYPQELNDSTAIIGRQRRRGGVRRHDRRSVRRDARPGVGRSRW